MELRSLSTCILLLLLLQGICLARAQNCVATAISVIPSCAQNCILNGAVSIGCAGTDFDCQCQKTAALYAAVDDCVAAACPAASFQAVIDGASTVCDCASPNILARTASVFSVVSGTVPSSNSATATATAASASSSSGTVSAGASGSSGSSGSASSESYQGNGATWTGYTSVIPVATASVIGAAARPTAAADVIRYVVPVLVAGAAVI